ncbi:MAG: methionyl-tRNA formyltransferase [Proteobacteria bacterium]|nr:methionyl-tRNA formyltransferase [Pseudomonadota bacterium]
MKITVFTSNQPRHFRLIEKLSAIASEVFAVQECTTLFPGKKKDFYVASPIMEEYFSHVRAAEKRVFGDIAMPPKNCRSLALFLGDLNDIDVTALEPALQSDYYVVFGASFLKGPLAEILIANRAVNIHMGASPYYRGNSCNFWAAYDGRPDYIFGTIHMITKGLDNGPILLHALPRAQAIDPFVLGMVSVDVVQNAMCHHIKNGTLFDQPPVPQDRSREMRYTKNVDFHDEVAREYLSRRPSPEQVRQNIANRNLSAFIRPYVE